MVLFLIATTITLNNSSQVNQTSENPTSQGTHVLPPTLISLLLIIIILLIVYFLR
ncbi:unnamed protein product [Oncorhynchus mykiss]|uniref:Uncharacterized protein n=1 Tax=Oncorhynchus mykiss TaxID=8022 RepID=A0A060YEN3_ONCMY|nr:unnamed protein product [Oncorhynchus mykiss]